MSPFFSGSFGGSVVSAVPYPVFARSSPPSDLVPVTSLPIPLRYSFERWPIGSIRAHDQTNRLLYPLCDEYQVLDAAVGVSLVDDPEASKYPMPLTATGKYDVEVRNTTRVAGRASCCWLVCCVARVRCSGVVVDEWRGSTIARLLPNNLLLFLLVCFLHRNRTFSIRGYRSGLWG